MRFQLVVRVVFDGGSLESVKVDNIRPEVVPSSSRCHAEIVSDSG